ncbi:SH3 domain-containing protein, partial [Aeromonas veronii]|nr:SH3 domain-containing protein [Aeromonas veronii]
MSRFKILAFMSFLLVLVACSNVTEEATVEESVEAVANVEENVPLEELEPIPTPEKYEGDLELPINGATGYASVDLNLKTAPNVDSETIETLNAGTAFTIIKEEGNWWFVKDPTSEGWIDS